MSTNQISDDVRKELDRIDWSSLEVPREVVESNPKVAEQLAAGKATELITYSVSMPGIPDPIERTVQLVSRRMKDEQSGAWVLDPKVGVKVMDEDYTLNRDNLKVVFDNSYSYRLDPEKDRRIIDSLLESRTYTNRETGEESRQYVCNICPEPLRITYKDGREAAFYLGMDNRSLRPVAISEAALRARFLDEQGHSRINHELFGKGIKVDDAMARALSEGKVSAAFGTGTRNGVPFGTAISFNVARGEITEDYTARGQELRTAAYEYLKKNSAAQKPVQAVQEQEQPQQKKISRKSAQKL